MFLLCRIGLSAIALLLPLAYGLSPVTVKGAKLFTAEDGNQFFVKGEWHACGVVYQRGAATGVDPLADSSQCEVDAGFMRDIGINTIRVYTTDPESDHDGCMQAFASQGIYVWVDLASALYYIDRGDPEYTLELFNRYAAIIDAFSQYNNTLSFTAANEVINAKNTISGAPYIKAVVRDLKAFRDARGYRKIPISYTASDVVPLQLPTKDYLSCGGEEDGVELYGMNVYSWCGNSNYSMSGYDRVYTQFQDSNIPALFAETGCTLTSPRTFGEVSAILGAVFPAAFAGVVVYEWVQGANGYGLVEYPQSDGTGFPSTLADYSNLGAVYATASPVSTAMSAYTPTNSPPACPTSDSTWPLSAGESLPTIQALRLDTVTARTTYYSSPAGTATHLNAAASSTTTARPAGADSSSEQGGGQAALSTGAIAGIAVGGAVVGIAFAVAGFFVLRQRRARRSSLQHSDASDPHMGVSDDGSAAYNKAELPAGSANPFLAKQELQTSEVYEAENAPRVHELDHSGQRHAYEMPASGSEREELEGTSASREMQ